jgi:2',3'-cyclic-nucleotide 2'-phosphodiesterase/3'-nucleotidase/5'-nucleotidase
MVIRSLKNEPKNIKGGYPVYQRKPSLTAAILGLLLVFNLYLSIISPAAFAVSPLKTFDFIEITDFHGYLQNSAKLSDGTAIVEQRAAVLAKQIKEIKSVNPNTIVFSGGDMFQGTPLSNVLKGRPVIEMMNSIGFDAMALGNHEYDWGIEAVMNTRTATLKGSSIPVLAANVYDKKTNRPVSYVKPYILLNKGGIKIGVIGIVDNIEFPTSIMPAYIQDVDFKDPLPIVNTLAQQLRNKGAQIVIVLAHMGASREPGTGVFSGHLIDLADKVQGVDAILGGHTHTVVTVYRHGIPVGIAGNYGQGYLDLKMTVDANGKVKSGELTYYDGFNLYNTPKPIVDSAVQLIVNRAVKDVGTEFNKVIGTAVSDLTRSQSAKPFGDSVLGNWTADITRKAVNADFGFVNNGGLRCDIPKGDITVGLMFQFMPFDNTIVTLKMTPAQIKTLLEQAVQDNGKGIQLSGLSFTYDPAKPSMQRVVAMKTTDGKPLDDHHSYLVATNNFMGAGGDGFLAFTDPAVAKTYRDSYKLARDVYIDAVRTQKQVAAGVDGRIAPANKGQTVIQPVDNKNIPVKPAA